MMALARLPRILGFLPCAEDCGDLVAGEPPQTELAAAFEQWLWMGKVLPLEDEVAAVFDLGDHVEPRRKAEPGALLGGELRAQDQCPVVEAFADDLRAQPIGGGLQRGNVIDREKGIVDLLEADLDSATATTSTPSRHSANCRSSPWPRRSCAEGRPWRTQRHTVSPSPRCPSLTGRPATK